MTEERAPRTPVVPSYREAAAAAAAAGDTPEAQAEARLLRELAQAREVLGRTDIHDLLMLMVERKASDLHVKAGSPPGLRIDGRMRPVGKEKLSAADTRRLVEDLLTEEQLERFVDEGDLDVSHTVPEVSRFRVNVLIQRGSMGLVIRHIPEDIPTMEELGLPEVCTVLVEQPRGLVLVTGPTGSGKTTTLAAMINHVNASMAGHIITMEDPIEFMHSDDQCWITQREIGKDSHDFPNALRRALRQDPDVIMVGEMRDLATISLAVTAAETGHLVFATLHTTSAVQTVDRIVDVFPHGQQQQIRMQLADNLRGIISQTLVPRLKGGRVAAMEILTTTDAVRATIRENKTPQLRNLIQTGAEHGMQTLETALNHLLARRVIDYDTAVSRANYPKHIRMPGAPKGGGGAPPSMAKAPPKRSSHAKLARGR